MKKRDRLESYIREEIDQIQFDGADDMWNDFQGRLSSKGWLRRYGLLLLLPLFLVLCATYLWYVNEDENSDQNILLSTDEILYHDKKIITSEAVIDEDKSRGIINLEEKEGTNVLKSSINTPLDRNDLLSVRIEEDTPLDKAKVKKGIHKGTYVSESSGIRERVNNQNKLTIKNSGEPLITPNKIHEHLENKAISTENKVNRYEDEIIDIVSNESNRSLDYIMKDTDGIQSMGSPWIYEMKNKLTVNSLSSIIHTPSSNKKYFITFQNGIGRNGIIQNSLGLGTRINLPGALKLLPHVGGSLHYGYSFSQDSLFLLNGLSIEEIRIDKDLQRIGNLYTNLQVLYPSGRWEYGLGLKFEYALWNQFYIAERYRITHQGSFNSSSGTLNETVERSSWDGINRFSWEAQFFTQYRIRQDITLGLRITKRLNKLIIEEGARKAYSNTPVNIGASLYKFF